MKAHRIILYLCLLTLSTNLLGQASVYGEINTTANTNSIIRAWGNQFIIYAEGVGGRGYFHLLTGIANGSTVLTADVPVDMHVKDFKVLNDWVYFVGEKEDPDGVKNATKAVAGAFPIHNLFYSGGNIIYTELHPYSDFSGRIFKPISLSRTEVYSFDGIVHIIAVGNQTENDILLTSAVFDIPYPFNSYSYKAVSSGGGYGEGIFFDLALTDNYVVSVAHKGSSYDMISTGYIMMRPFKRNGDPLSSSTGVNLYTTDGYIRPNGIMAATGLAGDKFAISYCEPGTTATAQETGILQVNTGGTISPVLFKRTGNNLSNSNYYNFKDMVFNIPSGLLCDLGNGNTSGNYLVGVYSTAGTSDSRFYHPDIDINSICTLTTDHCAACGKTQTSSLGIILQKLPISSTCTVVRGETMSQTFPSLINGPGITVKDSETSTKSHPPTITTNFFIVNCSK